MIKSCFFPIERGMLGDMSRPFIPRGGPVNLSVNGASEAKPIPASLHLLSIAGKIFARILLNRLAEHLDKGLLPESQCGFRKERGTNNDFRCQTAPGKVSRAAPRPLSHLCGLDKSLRHSEQRRTVEDHGQIWMSPKVHHHGPSVP